MATYSSPQNPSAISEACFRIDRAGIQWPWLGTSPRLQGKSERIDGYRAGECPLAAQKDDNAENTTTDAF